ncbi:MAG: ATPase, T2SS/T4P/T4SS family [Phycisphaerae bacterium]|nr:ATPase, T2SS/T4P/T4SS family [Phycisphaerae bacterium]
MDVAIDKEQNAKTSQHLRFGEMLVGKGLISRRELTEALNEQRTGGGRLGEVLLRLNMLNTDDVTDALAEHLSMDCIRFDDAARIDMNLARKLPEAIARRYCLLPFGMMDGKVIVAMADPLNVVAIDTVSLKLKQPIKVVISSKQEVNQAIELVYHGSDMEEQRLRDLVELEDYEDGKIESILSEAELDAGDVENEASAAPVVQFVELLMSQAVKSRASDIHIEPQEKSMVIRMRIDGVLRDMVPPTRKMQAAVVTRIKILSEMNIAEKRLPQDGRFKIRVAGRQIDVRVSVIPIIYGEKVVMRILDTAAVNHNVDALGFEPQLLKKFKQQLSQPHGIIIVTGPTGSGKSTTLYSALNYLKDPRKNITTVEDPVEYRLAGINQVQIKQEIDLDFAICLRAILRQDPDIVLIGEIRDKETIDIAIKASLTGHLVLSTFHTNDAPSAISRMVYMGVEPYLLASSLNLIIAQRLIRRLCEKCKEPAEVTEDVIAQLRLQPEEAHDMKLFKPKGCNKCSNTGFLGRLPIFEFLPIDTQIREKLVEGVSEAQIRTLARQKGYGGLLESGIMKIKAGLTTPEEVLGVTFLED